MPHATRRGFLRSVLGATAAVALVPEAASAAAGAAAAAPAGDPPASLDLWVNGKAVRVTPGPTETTLELVRERLGLTGTKHGCGHGACGACTVLVDGASVASCLHPASHLGGRHLETVETFADGAKLHPMQRAFAAEDALQCGYCTPGFVTEAVAFFARWRAEKGRVAPSRDEVAGALAGHLCRCGAYGAIYAAVQAACAGQYDEDSAVAPPRVEAVEKVTGRARYTVDVRLEGQLEGVLFRSPHASAILRRLDLAPALKVPGVRGAVALAEVGARARFVGHEIAVLAAESREAARAGLAAIVAEWEVLPAAITLAAARAPGAPVVFEPHATMPLGAELPTTPAKWSGNARGPTDLSIGGRPGAVPRALADASVVLVEDTWTTEPLCHTALEPHAALAMWQDNGLDVWLSTQAVTAMADDLAEVFGLTRDRVRVHTEHVGGGFGAKASFDIQIKACVEIAKVTGRAVRLVLDRPGELTVAIRAGQEANLRVGAKADGSPAGLDLEAYGHGGACIGNSMGILFRLLYPFAEKRLQEWDIASNTPPTRPMRGPGGFPALFALEGAMDELATKLGKDTLALRRGWDPNPVRNRLYDRVEALPLWKDRPQSGQTGRFRRGVGLANGAWMYFLQGNTEVQAEVADGLIVLRTAAQDMGNGTRTVIAETAARVLGADRSLFRVELGESSFPTGPMSAGSRTTASIVPAVEDALTQLAADLASRAGRALGLQQAKAAPGGVAHAGGLAPWADVLKVAPRMSRIGHRRHDHAPYFLPFAIANLSIGNHLGVAVQVAEVEVDTWLGRVRVLRTWTGVGVGHIAVPRLARSQVEGGVIQGVGAALYEARLVDPVTGGLVSANLEDYRVPGIADAPEMAVEFDEAGYEDVLGGGIGLSELVAVPVAASIANAVRAATGWAPRALPLRPDRVLAGVSA